MILILILIILNMQWDSMFSVVCLAAALSLSPLLSARWKRLNETFILSSVCSTELLYVTRTGQIGLPAAVLCRRFFNEPQLTRQRHQNPADTQRPAGIYRAEPRLRSSGPLSPFTRRKALSSSGDKVPIAGLCVCVCLFLCGAASCSLCRLLMTRASEKGLLWSFYCLD